MSGGAAPKAGARAAPFAKAAGKGGAGKGKKAGGRKAAALKRLRSFLDAEEPQAVRWLVRAWEGQQASITYKELREAALGGALAQERLEEWQRGYARLVSEKLAPQWRKAMAAAAGEAQARFPRFLYDPGAGAAQAYVERHGAGLVAGLASEQRDALRAMVAQASRHGGMPADSLARLMRPVVGLTRPQAAANLNYYNARLESIREANPRMGQEAAEAKAREAAAIYAGRQHRYRAMNIARTELAAAYNEGAYGAMKDAQSKGYVGDCRKTWLTADDERTCASCGALDGAGANMDAPFGGGQMLPPAHPSCRCAVAYEEVAPPAAPAEPLGPMEPLGPLEPDEADVKSAEENHDILTSALASGKVGDMDGYTVIDSIKDVDFNDSNAVRIEIEEFCAKFKDAEVEHALILTKSGKAFELTGTVGAVNPEVIGLEELEGSIGAHNHPVLAGDRMGDSFSREDVLFAARHKTGIGYLVAGDRMDAFLYSGGLSEEDLYQVYKVAENEVLKRAWDNGLAIQWRQAEIMREIANNLEGFIYHEGVR